MIECSVGTRTAGLPFARAWMVVALLSVGCAEPAPPPVAAEVGEPLPGLSDAELARFEAGRTLFSHPFTPEEGLGPRFNENACDACHTFPAPGGTGETAVTKRTRVLDDGCDLLVAQGGLNVRRQVTEAMAAAGGVEVREVAGATHSSVFSIPFTFGLGLVDAIPLETLETLADPEDRDGDGISGRIGRDAAGRPARFGRKADVARLSDFVDSAFRLEMGLTTPAHPDESLAGGGHGVPEGVDPAPEPEIGPEEFALVMDFMRFLAPPAPMASDDPSVTEGRDLFTSIGCARCHLPELRTGEAKSEALSRRTVALYSDLLLHDMGPELEGTCGPAAGTTEYRTEPLMGLRYRETYLHDGRSGRIRDAILLHGGEAAPVRDRFAALDRLTQEAILRFLGTL